MNSGLSINDQLMKEDIFQLFKEQLKKDFEGAGLDGSFADKLAVLFEDIKSKLICVLDPFIVSGSQYIPSLLYRVDISEHQLNQYQDEHRTLAFPEILAELLIKRILQKVILKKTFSK